MNDRNNDQTYDEMTPEQRQKVIQGWRKANKSFYESTCPEFKHLGVPFERPCRDIPIGVYRR